MARRIEFGIDEYYHVYDRGIEKRKLFLDVRDHERFTRLLCCANSLKDIHLSNYQNRSLPSVESGEKLVHIGAWCIMPNHFHILTKEIRENGTSLFMQKLLTGYTMYFNRKYDHKGALFEGRYHAKHLDDDNYLKYQYAYIHLNLIGIVDVGWKEKKLSQSEKGKDFIKHYRFSSLQEYLGDKQRVESSILDKASFPEYFASPHSFNDMLDYWIDFSDNDSMSRSDLDIGEDWKKI